VEKKTKSVIKGAVIGAVALPFAVTLWQCNEKDMKRLSEDAKIYYEFEYFYEHILKKNIVDTDKAEVEADWQKFYQDKKLQVIVSEKMGITPKLEDRQQ
jgi:hypothetical protein